MDVPSLIEVDEGERVLFTWEDGSRTSISAPALRASCLCADCRSDAGAQRKARVLLEPESIRIEGASMVGAYAVNFVFAPDNHRTGIFSFEQLQELGTSVPGPGTEGPAMKATQSVATMRSIGLIVLLAVSDPIIDFAV